MIDAVKDQILPWPVISSHERFLPSKQEAVSAFSDTHIESDMIINIINWPKIESDTIPSDSGPMAVQTGRILHAGCGSLHVGGIFVSWHTSS